MSEEAPTPDAAAAKDAGAAKPSKLLPMMVGLNTLLVAGVLALQFIHPSGAAAATTGKHAGKEGHEAKEGEKGEGGEGHGEGGEKSAEGGENGAPVGPTLKLNEFVVHLRNPEVDRYARMTFELEVSGEKDKADLTAQQPKVRDAFISYLSDRTVEELRGSEGLEKTKQALLGRLAAVAPTVHARALYITDLVLQ